VSGSPTPCQAQGIIASARGDAVTLPCSVLPESLGAHDVSDQSRSGLTPCMKDGDEAELAAQMPGIGRDGLQRCNHRVEQDAVDLALVLIRDRCDLGRHRESDMEIGHRQQAGLPLGEPLLTRGALALRAVPVAAGVVGNTDVAAILARLDMTTQRCRTAQLDRGHDTTLHPAEMTVVRLGVGRTMAAKDIRHLQFGSHGPGSGGRHHLKGQTV